MIYGDFKDIFTFLDNQLKKDMWDHTVGKIEFGPYHKDTEQPKRHDMELLLEKYNNLKKEVTRLEQENIQLHKMVTQATRPVVEDSAIIDAVRITLRKVIEILEMLLKRI